MSISYRAAQSLIKRGDEVNLRKALDERLDANLANQNGWTLLMLAAVEGDVSIGRLLLEHSADPALRNNKDESAQTLANHRGFAEFVKLLEGDAEQPK